MDQAEVTRKAEQMRALTDEVHAIFINASVDRNIALCCIGVAIAEQFTDRDELNKALAIVTKFAEDVANAPPEDFDTVEA